MKKIITLFAFFSFLAISSCSSSDDNFQEDNDTFPIAFEIKASFLNSSDDGYIISDSFSKYLGADLYQYESVLIYRLEGKNDVGSDVWQLIPTTVFFLNESITYDYNFSKQYFTIFVGGDNVAERLNYINNQVFRIVVVPADFGTSVDATNYVEVMNTLKLSENQVKKVKL